MRPLAILLLGLASACRAAPPPAVEIADFASDGCSRFPDGTYFSCCYVHDVAYWAGGTEDERLAADEALRACVIEITDNHALAGTMYHGVRMGGGPGHHTTYRWGYGWPWPYRRDYAPLTDEERLQVEKGRQRLCAGLTRNAATGGYVVDGTREISAAQAQGICPDLAGKG